MRRRFFTEVLLGFGLFLTLFPACEGGDAEPVVTCPSDGVQAAREGLTCVWSQAITETGFRCPPHMSHGYQQDDRFVCSADPNLTPQEVSELVDRTLPSAQGPSQFDSNKIDILWVVDDSGSMCEEQTSLREHFDAFVIELKDSGADFNLAVTTTDIQTRPGEFQSGPGVDGISCEVSNDLDDCPDDLPLVVSSEDPRYQQGGELDVALVQRDFGCNTAVGSGGDGFEAGLEAALLALSPELLSTTNSGFLREDAKLAIVFMTDENDCSDRGVLDKVNGNVCEWERDRLVPVQEYVDAFRAIKGGQGDVILAGIIALDDGVRYSTGEAVSPACESEEGGEAYAGYRYQEVIEAFSNHELASICEPPFDTVLADLGEASVEAMSKICLSRVPATCASDDDCGEGVCQSRGGQERFCDSMVIRVEFTRASAMPGRQCTPLLNGDQRCVLIEDIDYTVNYDDPGCGSGLSINLAIPKTDEDTVTIRHPTQL